MNNRELKLEIMFIRQVESARKMRAGIDPEAEAPEPVIHAHACGHCDTTWSCHCENGNLVNYWIKKHGCPEQLEYSMKMAILMSMAEREESPSKGKVVKVSKELVENKKLLAELLALKAKVSNG